MKVQRHATGSVRFDKRRKTWNYLWYDGATRRSKLIGSKGAFPTKAAAWLELKRIIRSNVGEPAIRKDGNTLREVVARYEEE